MVIRVAHIIGKMLAGGVETVVFNYYKAIDHSKIQFDFYYDQDSIVEPPQDLIDMGARFIMLPPYQSLSKYISELRVHLRNENYSIIHSHLNTLSVFPLYAAWRENVPIRIAHNHSVPGRDKFMRNVIKHMLRPFSKLFSTDYFACSEKAGRWLFGDRTFNEGKVYVMKNALDFQKFKSHIIQRENNRRELGVENQFVLGCVGRFTHAKNHIFVLDVFKEILKTRDARLLLVGDGELRDSITEYASRLGIRSKIIFTGIVSNPEKYYSVMDVVVVPSFFEGLSLVTIESQVAGIPSVISNSIPNEAIISNGCDCVELSENKKKWANAVIDAGGKSVTLNEKAFDYNIEKQAKKLENWYMNILE